MDNSKKFNGAEKKINERKDKGKKKIEKMYFSCAQHSPSTMTKKTINKLTVHPNISQE